MTQDLNVSGRQSDRGWRWSFSHARIGRGIIATSSRLDKNNQLLKKRNSLRFFASTTIFHLCYSAVDWLKRPPTLKSALIDGYTNERKPADGEFYYKICLCQGVFGTENPYFERRWWARLAALLTSTNKTDLSSYSDTGNLYLHLRLFNTSQYYTAV